MTNDALGLLALRHNCPCFVVASAKIWTRISISKRLLCSGKTSSYLLEWKHLVNLSNKKKSDQDESKPFTTHHLKLLPQTTLPPTVLHQQHFTREALPIGPWHLLGCAAADAEFGWGPVRDKWKPNPPPNLRLSFAAQSRVFSSFCRGSGAFKFLPWIRRLQVSVVDPAPASSCC